MSAPSSISAIRFGAANAEHSISTIKISAAGRINFFINQHILSLNQKNIFFINYRYNYTLEEGRRGTGILPRCLTILERLR